MRLFVQILAHKEKIYFAPYVQNIKGHSSYYTPFERLSIESTPSDIGYAILRSFDLANSIDVQADAVHDVIETQLQLKTWMSVVKKCLHAEVIQQNQLSNIEVARSYTKGGGILSEKMYEATLDDPEDIGKKVLEALYYYKK